MSERNPGVDFNNSWIQNIHVNLPAVKRRAETLGTRRTVKKQWQAAWLLKAVSCLDLTTLSGDDTRSNVQRLCYKAQNPVRRDLLDAMNVTHLDITVAAVCVYPNRLQDCVKYLKQCGSTKVAIASVAAGFPSGQFPLSTRLQEIREAVANGATEIDIVINRDYALSGNWKDVAECATMYDADSVAVDVKYQLHQWTTVNCFSRPGVYDEVRAMREACGDAHLKTILATGDLGSLSNVYKASIVAMMAGSDFIKTSTGKEGVNATLVVALVMVRAIRAYYDITGYKIGFKPAGGIRTAKDACVWLSLMKEELGNDWLKPSLFRFGASSLLTDIERQLFHFVTGRYAASHEFPMS